MNRDRKPLDFEATGVLSAEDMAEAMGKLEKTVNSDEMKSAAKSVGKSAFSLWWNVMPTPVKVVAGVGIVLSLGIAGLIITALVKFVTG